MPQPNDCPTVGIDDVAFGPFLVQYSAGTDPRFAEYRLRYDAFVEEHQWESATACPDRLERDEFDRFSCSALIVDAATGAAAACQRLILPELLPDGWLTNAERKCPAFPERAGVGVPVSRRAWVEASRLTIAPAYRWGSARVAVPTIVAVSYASLALALALDRTVVFTVSDPRTARLTRRIGISMRQVGATFSFHGTRAVFQIELGDVLRTIPRNWHASVERLIEHARRWLPAETIDVRLPRHAA